MLNFESFLKQVVNQDVSDIHLRINEVPVVRKNGIMMRTNASILTSEDLQNISDKILPEKIKNNVDEQYSCDFFYELENVSRFRVNYAKNLQNPMFVMRVVPYEAPTFEDKKIPNALKSVCSAPNGLVLVTGPTGCGKSTTLFAMLNYINENYYKHVVTLEDPPEFVYTNKKCVFSQHNIGLDEKDYPSGIKASLRQDPDILLIGEIRDRETAKEALSAAETGHLVFSTMHTSDAVKTINRIVDFFEPHERPLIRSQLAQVLQATVAQKLLPNVDNTSRVPAFEILMATPAIKDYIVKDEAESIYKLIQSGQYEDMITLNMYLAILVKEKLISQEVALGASENVNELQQIFKGTYSLGNKKLKLFTHQ